MGEEPGRDKASRRRRGIVLAVGAALLGVLLAVIDHALNLSYWGGIAVGCAVAGVYVPVGLLWLEQPWKGS